MYKRAIDEICEGYTVGEEKSGDLSSIFGYDIYYNKMNYEMTYTIERVDKEIIVAIMDGT